jgi:hypothetical protein
MFVRMSTAIAILTLAGAANAQTSTICNRIGNQVYCNTSAPPAAQIDQSVALQVRTPDFSAAIMAGRARQEAQANAQAQAVMDRAAAEAKADWASHIGDLIAAGQCEQARNESLHAGDLNMAEQVGKLCAPVGVAH